MKLLLIQEIPPQIVAKYQRSVFYEWCPLMTIPDESIVGLQELRVPTLQRGVVTCARLSNDD